MRYKQHSGISQIHGVGGIWGLGSRNLNSLALPRVQPACCSRFRAALHGGPTPNGDGGDIRRVVDDRKLAWRAHPWPAWAVGRLRPLGRLRSTLLAVQYATPTECVHVVVSSPTATQSWNTFLRGFISRFNTLTYLKINQALPGDACIPHSRHWRPRGVRSKKPGSRDA